MQLAYNANTEQIGTALRIVHIINNLPAIGGAERLLVDLAHCADSRPVTVITWWGTDNSLVQGGNPDIDLVPIRPFSVGNLARAIAAIRAADVIHAHLFPTQHRAALPPRPVLFTEHNTWNRRRDRRWLRPVERWCYARFSKVVAISDEVGNALAGWLKKQPPALETIPNGIRLERFRAPARRSPARNDFVLGMAARFAVEKDHEALIRALALLPDRFRLRLAGDGPLRQQLVDLAAVLGVAQRVEFVGIARDMRDFFLNIDLYVQSSRFDGFSIVSVEAMASGLPTLVSISTDCGTPPGCVTRYSPPANRRRSPRSSGRSRNQTTFTVDSPVTPSDRPRFSTSI